MGLLGDWLGGMRMKDPVDVDAHVVSCSGAPDHATSANCSMTLVVQPPGAQATTVKHDMMAPTRKWPHPGQTLPVTIDRADPDKLRVRWDDVATWEEQGADQAQQMADAINAGGAPGIVAGGAGADVISALQQAFPGAVIQVEGATVEGAPQPQPGAQPQAAADPVAQLEKLAKLKEIGALSDAEFEQAKARILNG